jgi:hypothetical protein
VRKASLSRHNFPSIFRSMIIPFSATCVFPQFRPLNSIEHETSEHSAQIAIQQGSIVPSLAMIFTFTTVAIFHILGGLAPDRAEEQSHSLSAQITSVLDPSPL